MQSLFQFNGLMVLYTRRIRIGLIMDCFNLAGIAKTAVYYVCRFRIRVLMGDGSLRKEMVFPILFAFLTLAIVAGYVGLIVLFPLPLLIKIIAGAVVVALTVAMVYVLVQRNAELKKEDGIDLGKY